jgi:hypothetical protein
MRKPYTEQEWIVRGRELLSSKSIQSADGCILWNGYVHKTCGYGVQKFMGMPRDVRRVALICAGMQHKKGVVIPSCGNRLCINPEHLSLVNRQVWREKRFPTVFPIGAGEKNGRARLNESLVRKMRKDRDVGKKVSELSEEYGVSESTVREILSKNLWKHC